MKIEISLKTLFSAIFGLIFLFVAGFYASGWTEPSSSYPDDNVPLPLNVGSAGQTKEGGLILNTGGATNGLIVAEGKVGIGTTSPSQKLDVNGNISASQYCISGTCKSSWFDGAKMTKSTTQTIPNTSITKITLNTIEFYTTDGSVTPSTSTSRFTINESGYYLVNASWFCPNIPKENIISLYMFIYRNGSILSYSKSSAGETSATSLGFLGNTDIFYLSEGDYLEMYVYQNSGSSKSTSTSIAGPRMSVVRLY